MSQLDGIHELFGNIAFPETPEERDDAERKILALVREQAAKLDLIANQVNATEELCRMNGRDPDLASVPAAAIRHALEATK